MADNVELNPGTGGATIAADEIAGVQHQRVKIQHGADGSATDVSSASPLPVTGDLSLTGSLSVAISNTVTVADGAVSSLSSSYTVAIKGTPNVEVVGDVSLTGSMSVAISGTPNVEVVGDVSLTGSMSVVITSGSVTVSGSVSLTGSMSVVVSGTATVGGVAAHDAAVSGNPLLNGFEARTTNPTAVADGDVVRAMADDLGRQVVIMSSPRDLVTDAHLTSLSASTTQTLLAAGAAGVFHDLTLITLANFSSSVANVKIFDGVTGGTERFRFDLAADGGGAIINFVVPFKQAAAATAWAIQSTELDVAVTVQAIKTV